MGHGDNPTFVDRRIAMSELAAARVVVRWRRGRVELGQARGSSARVRTTAPAVRGLRRLLARPPVRIRRGVLLIRGQGRLQVDLPVSPATATPVARQVAVHVSVRGGEVTSWGAGGSLALHCPGGRVTCRELTASQVVVRAVRVSLHFAVPPERVEVTAESVTLAVPAGEYAVDAPPEAEVSVAHQPGAARTIVVQGAEVRILAAESPLRLTDEPGCGG